MTTDGPESITTTSRIGVLGAPPLGGLDRVATIPGLAEPLGLGVHRDWAAHYGIAEDRFPERPTTTDVFVAAVGSCLLGTFAWALAARGIEVVPGQLEADASGEAGPVPSRRVWIVRTITVAFTLELAEDLRPTADRVHGFYERECTLSQTLAGSRCAISSTLAFA
jgi:uncharacterized OsmC-like protein